MVAGYDRSAEDGEEEIGLTDMILYLQWDCDRNKLEVLQVPPSLYVGWSTGQAEAGEGEENAADPTGQGSTTGRINAVARETGGLQGLCDEITAMTGLPVDGYLGMDLNGLGDIVEYIGGIEVVKAFSQSAGSYKKYSDAVNYNANYYVDWMRENQKTMSAYNAILPSVLICVLPCGFAFWLSGSLELSTFLSPLPSQQDCIGPVFPGSRFDHSPDIQDDDYLFTLLMKDSGYLFQHFPFVGTKLEVVFHFPVTVFSGIPADGNHSHIRFFGFSPDQPFV